VSGSRRESVLREAFKDLLKRWGRARDLQFVAEHDIVTRQANRIYVDGALLHGLRVPFGYWEAKDEADDLLAEIEAKFRKGYPRDNIVFTDDVTAVLYQDGHEVARAGMQADNDSLLQLLTRFFAHERAEIADFNKAVKQFATDLPRILDALRDRIAEKLAASTAFAAALAAFLAHARDAINPAVGEDDVREMLIQHILTEDIFAKVFNDPEFHQKNNVAAELYKLEATLFARGEKQTLLKALDPYYSGIAATAALIGTHSEKQGFLKALYEDFYKAYNRKAADRLGVVYTPGEIVRFMIRSADWLCEKHFGRNLIDRGVEILDPATGTGTFIVELLEHFRGNHDKLRHKYKEELHANEVAILPYYVANLNIEATYQAITGQFAEFENLCFVDTLDNVAALGRYAGHMDDMFGGTSDENMARIKRQNERKISVVIGNPPYNAWQTDFNARNANRPYKRVDDRIGQTYRAQSNAQNTIALSDMYVRFWRWASDRLRDEGVLAFVTNRNFIDKVAFDGFRKSVQDEFADIWLVDLGGDVRANPKLSGSTHNVFGIQTGVTIAFMVKLAGNNRLANIRYARRPEMDRAADKVSWLQGQRIGNMAFESLKSDAKGNWLAGGGVAWETFLPLADTTAGPGDVAGYVEAVFRLTSNGVESGRDEWLWAWSKKDLRAKVRWFLSLYNAAVSSGSDGADVKLDRQLDKRLKARQKITEREGSYRAALSRPFLTKHVYFDQDLNAYRFRLPFFFPDTELNPTIMQLGVAAEARLSCLATDKLFDFGVLKTGNGRTQGVARYRYTKSGERVDNITDWALAQFQAQYGTPLPLREGQAASAARGEGERETAAGHPHPSAAGAAPSFSHREKDMIFHYVYAVLHDPVYRETYALNLKREFPRIPFYPDFARWAAWGEQLMAMHIGYEDVEPWPVERVDTPNPKRAPGTYPKPVLKSDPARGLVVIDADTQITGIPPEAWDYRLGNRSAIDWVLDQHKEKTPRDPTIAAKFNTYRFADHKEAMIALLAKVVRVSVDTVAITGAMRGIEREG
jgi:predicted helicase